MNREVASRLERARSTLEAAHLLLGEGLNNEAAAEAYYAMFHAASAALAARELAFSKHSAVISAFGREFAKTGAIDPAQHRALREAFDARQAATYDYTNTVAGDDAGSLIQQAEQFIAAIEHYLRRVEEQSCPG